MSSLGKMSGDILKQWTGILALNKLAGHSDQSLQMIELCLVTSKTFRTAFAHLSLDAVSNLRNYQRFDMSFLQSIDGWLNTL